MKRIIEKNQNGAELEYFFMKLETSKLLEDLNFIKYFEEFCRELGFRHEVHSQTGSQRSREIERIGQIFLGEAVTRRYSD